MKSGKSKVFDNAMVREVLTDGNGKATGVVYIDKNTRREKVIHARAVVLAASACESARILLNSKTKEFPNGVANASGVVGRFLMDTVGFGLSGYVPAMKKECRTTTRTASAGRTCSCRWWKWDKHHELDFPRGYHVEIGGGYGMPGIGSFQGAARLVGMARALRNWRARSMAPRLASRDAGR